MSKLNRWLRSKEKTFLIVICCFLMVAWYGGSTIFTMLGKPSGQGGSIFDKSISDEELIAMAQRLAALSQQRLPPSVAIAKAWEIFLLNEEAQRYGIHIAPSDIRSAIQERFPNKAGDGISQKAYNDHLQTLSLTTTAYEKTLKAVLAANHVQQLVIGNVSLPPEEAWLWYNRNNEKIQTRYIMLRAEDLAPLITLQEKDVKAFYEKYADTPRVPGSPQPGYQDPEKVQIEYILAPFKKSLDAVNITSAQVEDYYKKHKQKYRLPEKPPPKEEGKDASPAPKKTEPEYKPLDDVKEDIQKTLRNEAAWNKAKEIINKVNLEIDSLLSARSDESEAGDVDLKALAQKHGLEYRRTRFFTMDQINTILPGAFALAQKAFGQGIRDLRYPKPPMKADEGYFIFQLLNSRLPQPPPFESIKPEVEKDLRLIHGLILADAIAASVRTAKDFTEAEKLIRNEIARRATEAGVNPEPDSKEKTWFLTGKSDFFARPRPRWGFDGSRYMDHRNTGLPGPYNYARFASAAFDTEPDKIGSAVEPQLQRAAIVFQRIAYKPADREQFKKNAETVSRELLQEKRAAVISGWRRDLIVRAAPSEEVLKKLFILPEWQKAFFAIKNL